MGAGLILRKCIQRYFTPMGFTFGDVALHQFDFRIVDPQFHNGK